ncbi:hypothetical protein TVAG_076360 [Trichomonas vaginalis G3]|uniref:SEC7 domain-containing protein n=1 Tax=Trichomonas vaginalis (strain ATCC PRA-98 / G3) TaxID=412133 RepID=A2D9N3_TRIV3|nr:Sec7 domain family [Trichomonas vaginalis G3]EAY22889.1 hypothetical protein TVAG_076360 [Trichomonas vaginalis G3]KAI5527395.1 Sec7 domain family [Trichomonas vaginalis G3]|eukprot:XP_001583875.1 hypothetical protein [Trichomonas vaginalis G3]
MAESAELNLYQKCVYCLPSKAPYEPWYGQIPNKESIMIPTDIPSTLTESMAESYATSPEQVLKKFLETNPNFYNPRDIARIIFHSPNISPYANAFIIYNSDFAVQMHKALLRSFITAIDLDCVSLIDAISAITAKIAIPEKIIAIQFFVTTFAHIYCIRNTLEWPDKKIVEDIFYAIIASALNKQKFADIIDKYQSFKKISKYVLDQISFEVEHHPPPIYFTALPVNFPQSLEAELEHEGRFINSWSSFYYEFAKTNTGNGETGMIKYYPNKNKDDLRGEIPLEFAFASPKQGIKNKPWVLQISKRDGTSFGRKKKDGVMKSSPRTQYTLAINNEKDLLTWISAINFKYVHTEISPYLIPATK